MTTPEAVVERLQGLKPIEVLQLVEEGLNALAWATNPTPEEHERICLYAEAIFVSMHEGGIDRIAHGLMLCSTLLTHIRGTYEQNEAAARLVESAFSEAEP